jgi:hypothetical protein
MTCTASKTGIKEALAQSLNIIVLSLLLFIFIFFMDSRYSMIITSKNTNSSIPIIVATEPLIGRAIGWVLIGLLISIIFWEIINSLSQMTRKSQREVLEQRAEAIHSLKTVGRDIEYQANLQAAAIIRVKEEEYKKRYSMSGAPRQSILNIGSAFFGILVGLLALVTTITLLDYALSISMP